MFLLIAEYGVNVAISTKGDVYSFGVLLLEMITGNRPTDQKFNDGITLHDYISKAWPNNISEIVDRHFMLQNAININDMMHNCIVPLVQIGLSCSMASPKARPEMEKVCSEILVIKHAFSSINVIWNKASAKGGLDCLVISIYVSIIYYLRFG